MSSTSSLRRLTCGSPEPGSALSEVLTHLGVTVDAILEQIHKFQIDPPSDSVLTLYGPFLCRSLLEVGFTALVGRLDPFRVLVLREIQRVQTDESSGKRNLVAVQWSGDILSDEKDTKGKELWKTDRQVKDMTRALLGDYNEHVLWRQAFLRLIDKVQEPQGGEWMRELRRLPPEGFVSSMRREASRLYSTCSKGVHHEFVISPGKSLDKNTVLGLMTDAAKLVANLALAANMVTHLPFALAEEDAVACYENCQQSMEDKR